MRPNNLAQLIYGFIKRLPILLPIALVGIYSILFVLKQESLMIRGSYLILPIIIIFIYGIKSTKNKQNMHINDMFLILKPFSFKTITLFFVLIQLISICFIVLQNERTISYFIALAFSIVLITIQILSSESEHTIYRGIIISEVVFLFLNIVLSQTLKFPLYFGSTDPLMHISAIESVINTGRVTAELGNYEKAPLFHIWGALNTILLKMNLQSSFFLLYSLAFSCTIPMIYIFTFKIVKHTQVSLIAALLYAISAETIFAGMGVTTRVFCFIFVLMFLLLFIQNDNKVKVYLSIILIPTLVLTHQTTLIQFFGILVLLMILEYIIKGNNHNYDLKIIALYFICFFGYWMYISDFVFARLISSIMNTSEVALPDTSVINKSLSSSLWGNMDQSLIFLFGIVGIVTSITITNRKQGLTIYSMVFGLIALMFYIDTPLQYLTYMLLTSRLPLLVSPFVVLAMAYGIYTFVSRKIIHNIFCIGSIVIFGICSILILGNSTDLNLGSVLGYENRKYFTKSELSAFNNIIQFQNDKSTMLFTDWQTSRYFQAYSNIDETSLISWPTQSNNDYYYLLRREELADKKFLKFSMQTGASRAISVLAYEEEINKWTSLRNENKIYENKTVEFYYIMRD